MKGGKQGQVLPTETEDGQGRGWEGDGRSLVSVWEGLLQTQPKVYNSSANLISSDHHLR